MELIEFDPHLLEREIAKGPVGLLELQKRASNPTKLRTMLIELKALGIIEKHDIQRLHRWTLAGFEVKRGPVPKKKKPLRLLPVIKAGPPRTADELQDFLGESHKRVANALRELRKRKLVKQKAVGKDGLWRYVPAAFEPTNEDMAAAILERSYEEGDCRIWRDACDRQGHPLMRFEGNNRRVALVLWKLLGKPVLGKHLTPVMTCGCKQCVLPEHLGATTRAKTMKEAYKKKGAPTPMERLRRSRAMRKVHGKFTDEDIAYIRASDESSAELAKRYNCWSGSIRNIRGNRRSSPIAQVGMFAQLLAA